MLSLLQTGGSTGARRDGYHFTNILSLGGGEGVGGPGRGENRGEKGRGGKRM